MVEAEVLAPTLLASGRVRVIATARVRMTCGCEMYVGRRTDSWEVATGLVNHAPLCPLGPELLRVFMESLMDPREDPLLDVIVELAEQVEQRAGATASGDTNDGGRG